MGAVTGGRDRAEQTIDQRALYEREFVTGAIGRVIDQARGGSGGAVFVRGDAGLGKTALLRWAGDLASGAMSIRRAHGSSMETDLALAFVEQLVSTREAARWALRAPGPLDRRILVHRFARERLGSWTDGGPLLVLLDDLHWADQDSLNVIAFVTRRLAGLPVALVGVLRPWPHSASNVVDGLMAEGFASVLDLPPLSRAASERLLGDLLGADVADETVGRVWAITQGNPFLLAQAARVVHREGALPTGDARWAGELVLSKIAGMPTQVVECARAVATLGGRTDLSAVQAVAALTDDEFADAFDTLVVAGVLRSVTAGDCELSHDLLAQNIIRDMGHARSRLLHRRAFAHYRSRHDTERAATHALRADLRGDTEAVATVAAAGGRALASGGIESGLGLLAAAIELAQPEPSSGLLMQYADALFTVGRAAEALDAYHRLAAHDPPAGVFGRIARALAHVGRFEESLAAYEHVLAELPPGSARNVSLLERIHVVWERDGPAGALASLDEIGVGLPGRLGLNVAAVRAFARLQAGDTGGMPAIEAAAAAARERLHVADDVGLSMNALALEVSAYTSLELHDAALTLVDDGIRALQGVGALRAAIPLRITHVRVLLEGGKLKQVISEAGVLEAEKDVDPLPLLHIRLLNALALARLGREADATAVCDDAERGPIALSWLSRIYLLMVRAEVLMFRGRPPDSLAVYRQVEDLAHRFGVGEPCTPMWAAGAIEAALSAGSVRDAARIARWLDERCAALPCSRPRMVALGAKAGCAAYDGDGDLAQQLYDEALAVPCAIPLERAAILLRYGAWLRRHGQVRRSREPLAQALQAAQECGAAPLARRAREELAVAGGRRRRARATNELTRQEARVASLAASRKTSREIGELLTLSTRTVDSHLAHIYRKLNLNSRRELVQRRDEFDATLSDEA